jgi:hypothetical protein
MAIKHRFVSARADTQDSSYVRSAEWNNTHLISSFALADGVIAPTPSANQNDYSPTGWNDTEPAQATVMLLNPSASLKLTGLAGGSTGRVAVIQNIATDYLVIVESQSALSTAANRFALRDHLFLMPGDSFAFVYDATNSRWRPLGRNPSLIEQFDCASDFYVAGGSVALTDRGCFPYSYFCSGTAAAISTTPGTQNARGVAALITGSTTTGVAGMGGATNDIVPGQGAALHLARIMPQTALSDGTNRYQIVTGFDTGSGQPTDGVYWQYDDAVSAFWQIVCAKASARTKTATALTVSIAHFDWLGIFVNPGWTRADFFYSSNLSGQWTFAGSQSGANMPVAALPPDLTMQKSLGTTSRTTLVDFLGHRIDAVRI